MGDDRPTLRFQAQCAGHEELRDIVIETRSEVRMLSGQITQFMDRLDKHNTRIDSLESYRDTQIGAERSTNRTAAIIAGGISTFGVLVGILIAFWPKVS